MQDTWLETFTNRREAIVLFEYLRRNDPNQPWPLLPILTFIAPSGRGKSTLLEYLRTAKCCLPNGRAILPYAYLDFTQIDAPRDLLSILVALRNQLQAHADGQSRNLTFPYFDLGAAIALATPRDGELPFFNTSEIQRRLAGAWPYFESLNEAGYALSNIIPIIPPLLAGLKSGAQIPALQELLHRLEYSSGWHWYRLQSGEMGLSSGANVSDVLLRLHALSRPGKADKPGREYLVQQVLPAALLADIRQALDSFNGPSAWNETTNVVLFLDGFDTLLSASDSGSLGLRLLEMLALSDQRKRGETDPLLLVIASNGLLNRIAWSSVGASAQRSGARINLSRPAPIDRPLSPASTPSSVDRPSSQSPNNPPPIDRFSSPSPNAPPALYEHWRQQLPGDKRLLQLGELFLPLELRNFELDDTSDYLLKTAELAERVSARGKGQYTAAFTVTGLVQAIHHFTRGHPLYLALANTCVLEAERHAKNLEPADFTGFEDDSSSSEIASTAQQAKTVFSPPPSITPVPTMFNGATVPVTPDVSTPLREGSEHFQEALAYEDISIAEYLCSLYLHQLTGREEDNLIFCALPRMLDIETLQMILQLSNHDEIQQLWNRYCRLPFVRLIDDERIVFHPIIRTLLLQRLPPTSSIEKNYHQIHARLQEHFHRRAFSRAKGNEYARIEEAYHAMALGDPEPAISLALFAQRTRLALWEPLLDAITEASPALMPAGISQRAVNALAAAMQHHRTQDIVLAIVLFTWLLTASQKERQKAAEIHNNLGAAYWILMSGDRQANLEKAIACYQAALQVYTRDTFPIDWATTQNNLGAAYWTLAGLDWRKRQANLEKAIACSKAALQVYTRNAFPDDWARTQFNLGRAYHDLPDENRQANLEKAIACYEATLQIYTRDALPTVWAKTYDRLGSAYLSLPGEDRQENLKKSIDCYKAALEVYTQQNFPVAWAKVQHRLGDAYRDVTDKDPQQANLKQAIAFYQAALQVYTPDSFPTEWAEAQDSLGYTYASLQSTNSQDRQANLAKAIACYQAALQVYTRDAFPSNWASTQNNLGYAYAFLPAADAPGQQQNLEKAITCYEGALQVFSSLQMDDYIQLVSNNLADAQERLQQP